MENYTDAALRHWKDAELLEKENRVENADHHYGFAAECAIKKVLAVHPDFVKQGMLDTPYKKHINVLWKRINLQSIQKVAPSLTAVLHTSNQFFDWSVDQRYAANSTVSPAAIQMHKKAASRLLGATGLAGVRRK
ncbi:MAG: hypothetical protein WC091_14260 [Sulfuricellaceae bacterium]